MFLNTRKALARGNLLEGRSKVQAAQRKDDVDVNGQSLRLLEYQHQCRTSFENERKR